MIGYLEGRIIHSEPDGILLLAGSVGYEIMLSPTTLAQVTAQAEEPVRLFVYYHVTERQPKPVLIGFPSLEDKAFFQLFITVSAIGPMKAVKALTRPVGEVARAIEEKDVSLLSGLPGIGKRTADKIIATLRGKVTLFASESVVHPPDEPAAVAPDNKDISQQVTDVLVEQLGHSAASARRMIREAFEKNPGIHTPEDLFDAIYQEEP